MSNITEEGRQYHILNTRELAVKHGTCKEQYYGGKLLEKESGCQYPHCHCLYGVRGPINPITGREIKR